MKKSISSVIRWPEIKFDALFLLPRYVFIINLILIVFSIILLNKIYRVWKPDENSGKKVRVTEEHIVFPEVKFSYPPKKQRNSFNIIVEKDVFRPQRTEWQNPDLAGEKGASNVAPQLLVFGIVITKEMKVAWVQEQGKSAKTKKIVEGESVGGWKVNKIEPNSILLKNGIQNIKYNLIEPGKPKTKTIPKINIPPSPRTPLAQPPSSALQQPPGIRPPPSIPQPPPLPQR